MQVTYQSVKWNNVVGLLKTVTWLNFALPLCSTGFVFVQYCYPMLLLPSFFNFGTLLQ